MFCVFLFFVARVRQRAHTPVEVGCHVSERGGRASAAVTSLNGHLTSPTAVCDVKIVKNSPSGGIFLEKSALQAAFSVFGWPNLETTFLTKKNRLAETSRLHIVGREIEAIKVPGRTL